MAEHNKVRVGVASGDPLDVRKFSFQMRMSELFRVEVEVVSANLSVALDEVIGNEASFTLERDDGLQTYTGLAIEMEQVRVDEQGLATYTLAIAPHAWLLTQRKNYRIFQFMSEIDIVSQLLGEWGVAHEVMVASGSHKPRKFRVQYGESDFTFMLRMLEDAGIAFYFEPAPDGTVLMLDDEPQQRDVSLPLLQYFDNPQLTKAHNYVTKVAALQAVKPAKMTISDVDYRRRATSQPRLDSVRGLPQEQQLEQHDYEPGAFLYHGSWGGGTPTADDRGASRTDEHAGKRKVENRLLGKRSSAKRVKLVSDALELAPGVTFSVTNHPHPILDPSSALLVLSSSITGKHDDTWQVAVEAASTTIPYRPEPITPKPTAGMESATVVGPAGEEIHTDEYGRVRVHFHWDRESRRNEESSCWLPTSQPWAGSAFGGINLPRIGQEVLVSFLNGDPDRPMVVGRVYTELNPPPDKLPQFKDLQSIWSESTPRLVMGAADGDPAGAPTSLLGDGTPMDSAQLAEAIQTNGFEARSPSGRDLSWPGSGVKLHDWYPNEMLYFQAQKDFNLVVNNCWRTLVRNMRSCMIGTDDQLEIGNSQATEIIGEQGVRVGKNQYLTVTHGRRLEEVTGSATLEVGADGMSVQALEKSITFRADTGNKTITVKSDERIEIVVKDSYIVIEGRSITIQAPKVHWQPVDGRSS